MRRRPKSVTDESGFTLPELIVVLAVLLVGVAITVFALRPTDYTIDDTMAERRTRAASLVQALVRYRQDTGAWPQGIGPEVKTLGNEEKPQVDLCPVLVPKYIDDIPVDPLIGYKLTPDQTSFTGDPCTAGIIYTSAFTVWTSKDGQQITVRAQGIDDASEIKITR